MRKLLCIICLLIVAAATAQEQVRYRRFSIGLGYSPDFNYRQLDYTSSVKWAADVRNDREIPRLGHTAGLHLRWRWADRLTIESGLLYSDKGYRTRKQPLQWAGPDVSYPVSSRVVYRYQTFDIPLKARYYFTTGRWKYYLSAGLIMSRMIGCRKVLFSYFADGSSSRHRNLQDMGYAEFFFSGTVGAGTEYALSKKFTVYAGPSYRQAFSSLLVDNDAREYLYSIGLDMGVVMQFRKR